MNMMAFLKQDSQCTYNVPLRHIVQPLMQGKSN